MQLTETPPSPGAVTNDALGGVLLPHQAAAVEWLRTHPRAVLADDVGLGKTVTALAYIEDLDRAGLLPQADKFGVRVLVVADAATVPQWQAETARFAPGMSVVTAEHPALARTKKPARWMKDWRADFPDGADVCIVGHEWARSRKDQLASYKPSLVITDEASALKGGGTEFDAIKALADKAPRSLAMTATPLETSPVELWQVLALANTPGLWPKRVYQDQFVLWESEYVTPDGVFVPPQAVDWLPAAAGTIREYLAGVLLRRTAPEAGLSLPEVDEETVWVPLNHAEQAAYDQAGRRWGRGKVLAREDAARRPLAQHVVSWLDDHPDEPKVVVYAEHHERLDTLAELLDESGIVHVRIDGKVPTGVRETRIRTFREDPKVRVLLGTRVLERGLNLQNAAVLLSLDASWNPKREAQRVGRIRRIGSPHATVRAVTFLGDTPQTRAKVDKLDRRVHIAEAVGL